MENQFIKRQQKLLEKQRANLERELDRIANKKKTGQKYEPKFLDIGSKEDEWAQEVATYEEYLILERNLEKILEEVNQSLEGIKKGRYGVCQSCKKEISQERLKIMPQASLCVGCGKKR